jgi:type II secretory pathway pseudopilin PulG
MTKRTGFSVLEMLLAFAVFSIVIALASAAIVQYLHLQSNQEAITSAQARLRRVSELLGQELRGAVLGGVINQPYTSTSQQLSAALLGGGAGYQIANLDGSKTGFVAVASSAGELGLASNDRIMLVGTNGQAVLRRVNSVTNEGSSLWRINHSACTFSLSLTDKPLMFQVRILGYRYDAASKTLYASENGTEQPLAFNINSFRIDYVYSNASGNIKLNPSGFPNRIVSIAGSNYSLTRLQLALSTQEMSRGKPIERSYNTQIELADSSGYLPSNAYSIEGVTSCL